MPTVRAQTAVVVDIAMVRVSLPHSEDNCPVRLNIHVQFVVEVNIFSVQISNLVDGFARGYCHGSYRHGAIGGEAGTGLYLGGDTCCVHVTIHDSPCSPRVCPVRALRVVAENLNRVHEWIGILIVVESVGSVAYAIGSCADILVGPATIVDAFEICPEVSSIGITVVPEVVGTL